MKKEIGEKLNEIEMILKEMNHCFDILVPQDFLARMQNDVENTEQKGGDIKGNHDVRGEGESERDTARRHGLGSVTEYELDISLSMVAPLAGMPIECIEVCS